MEDTMNKLFKVLHDLIDFFFESEKGGFIAVDKNGARWTTQDK